MDYTCTQLIRYLNGAPDEHPLHPSNSRLPASLLFGRAFEAAIESYFRRQEPHEVFRRKWAVARDSRTVYRPGDNWEMMLQEGFTLLNRFAQDSRIKIQDPERQLQIRVRRSISSNTAIIGQVDAMGMVDSVPSLIEWKTTGTRYPDEASSALDSNPQLTCYSWITHQAEVALIVFVRKRVPEIQYLRLTISDQQRQAFQTLAEAIVQQIECPPVATGGRAWCATTWIHHRCDQGGGLGLFDELDC